MSRCTAAAALVLSVFPLGCVSQVQAGTANAPALGGSPILEARTHDAISNGQESCELRQKGSPLRYSPSCPQATRRSELPEFVVARPVAKRSVILPLGYSDTWACDAAGMRRPIVGTWSIFPCELPRDLGPESHQGTPFVPLVRPVLLARAMSREQEMPSAFVPRRLVRAIARCLGVPPSLVTADARLCEDLGADVLEITRLALTLEADFEIDVPDAELAKVVTVKDVARLLLHGASRSLR